MKKYTFKEQIIENEYKYIFLCGTQYGRKNVTDKRNVLRQFLKDKNNTYRPIILEDNFIFKKNNSRYLVYDDIHMKDLYQVEMVTNYLSDNNIIIHESISTAAEIGLFLSEETAVKKTCLLLPDDMALEENKLGQFLKLAFMREPNGLKVINFYPRVEKNIVSDNVKYWHTYFYKDKIGSHLGMKINHFLEADNYIHKIRFARDVRKIQEGYIHYQIKDKKLEIRVLPRVLIFCIATVFNIEELAKKIFSAPKKELKEYIEDIKQCLLKTFINTIEEKTGEEIELCSINAQMNIKRVYIAGIIGMCLYLFQAADFIQIKKDDKYEENSKVEITRKMLSCKDGTSHFFYEKYKDCLNTVVETQVI